MTFRCLVALVLVASAASTPPHQEQPSPGPRAMQARDVTSRSGADGVIRGRVTSAGTDRPLHRVRIVLNGSAPNLPSAVTDALGNFELTDVPPGTYSITASRAGYLTRHYGQRAPRQAGRTVTIASGQVVERIDLALPRGAVLAGRISDDLGDPLPGARVEAVEARYTRGQRVAVPARIATTDDQGAFRLSGLESGTYQIRASSTDVWEGDDGQRTLTFGVTYFPGVSAADRPGSVKVADGEQLENLDFRLVSGNASRVSGTLQDANGNPLGAQVVYLSRIPRGSCRRGVDRVTSPRGPTGRSRSRTWTGSTCSASRDCRMGGC